MKINNALPMHYTLDRPYTNLYFDELQKNKEIKEVEKSR